MPEPFKNVFSADGVDHLARHLTRVSPDLDIARFRKTATGGLEDLELKARSNQIADALEDILPHEFDKSAQILVATLDPDETAGVDMTQAPSTEAGMRGWMVMPMAEVIARTGQEDLEVALDALKSMTKRFTAEFAIRPFLDRHPEAALAHLQAWTQDPNVHVRRLVSEGTRPRLPWGMQLKGFLKDPAPILPLLLALRDDPEEYVRRSVANNLNDIAKDHPDRVADLAKDWLVDAPRPRARLVRHALRTLVKAGHTGALDALGYGAPDVAVSAFTASETVTLGESLAFDVAFTAAKPQRLILDFAIHHQKANGTRTPKVFKWTEVTLAKGQSWSGSKHHPLRPVTTRRYYPGAHRVELLANGQVLAGAEFTLALP